MLGAYLQLLRGLTPLRHGCPSTGANISNTLEADHFFDAAFCPYADVFTAPIFAAFFIVGVVNLPIYIRQGSILVPFVITLIVGGLVLASVASVLQAIAITVILFTIGLGPVLVLWRAQR